MLMLANSTLANKTMTFEPNLYGGRSASKLQGLKFSQIGIKIFPKLSHFPQI